MKILYFLIFNIMTTINLHTANNFISITSEHTSLSDSINLQLFTAIKANKPVEKITDIVNRGANVNVKGPNNTTPLHEAAHNGNFGIAELLLKHGADSTAKNSVDATALDIAEIHGHEEIAKYLRNWDNDPLGVKGAIEE